MVPNRMFLFSLLFCLSNAEIFSSISDITGLLNSKGEILSILDSYIAKEESKISYIKQFKKDYEELTKSSSAQDTLSFLSNPIHAFLLIKKLTTDLQTLFQVITYKYAEDVVSKLTPQVNGIKVPDNTDLQGAAMGIVRIQDTYELNSSQIADGSIPGIKNSKKLTAHDCFELGRQAYFAKSYVHMIKWMEEALRRWQFEEPSTVERIDLLENMAYGFFMLEDYDKSLNITKEILGLDPSHTRSITNQALYEHMIKIKQDSKNKELTNTENESLKQESENKFEKNEMEPANGTFLNRDDSNLLLDALFKKLCRNEYQLPVSTTSKLECRYVDDHPFLKIQPIKLEELLQRPFLVVLHDLVRDHEIEFLKKTSAPYLQRALVWNETTHSGELSANRTSKFFWISDAHNPIVKTISNRISAVTKLSLTTAEHLQIANYGIGGHYDVHYDFLDHGDDSFIRTSREGNRIATVLIYLSDVEAGGATVFPLLGVAIQPKKGSAALWFNLYRNGIPNYQTKHGACPVISGSKWVCNKWLHERDQEFVYPCSLNKNR